MYELFQFIAQVAEDGYEWRPGPIQTFGPDVRKYDEPALIVLGERFATIQAGTRLFLKFASVDPEPMPRFFASRTATACSAAVLDGWH